VIKSAFTILIGCLAFSTLALAQDKNDEAFPCPNAVVTSDITECYDRALKRADQELNGAYQKIVKAIDGDALKKLKNAQRIWLRYRDATCDADMALYGSGTASGPHYLECMYYETRHRTDALIGSYGWILEKQRLGNQ